MRPNEVTLSQLRRGLPEIRQRSWKEPDEKNYLQNLLLYSVI